MTETVSIAESADAETRPWVPRRGTVRRLPIGLVFGMATIATLVLAGLVAPLPHGALAIYPDQGLQPPSSTYWLGTDDLGRDVFARVIRGARVDLPLALIGTMCSLAVGVPFGLVASRKTRLAERMMRGLDMFQAFPLLILAITIVALTGNSLRNVVLAITLVNVPRFIRLVRSEALALRESRFIEAATAIGASNTRILFRHLLPNVSGTILVQASLTAAQALVVIAALGYLGIGITPPTASWGAMIQTGSQAIATGQWWVLVFPSAAVFLAVFSLNRIAEGLEVVLDSSHRR